MALPSTEVPYLRFMLHQATDGQLVGEPAGGTPDGTRPTPEEVRTLLGLMAARGTRKVRLSGEDPAQRTDLPALVEMIAGLDGVEQVVMTTRGVGLRGRVKELAAAGLRGINVDLDSLRPERHRKLTGGDGFEVTWTVIDEAIEEGLTVKLNTVLQAGINDDEIHDFVTLAYDRPIDVRFVEWNTLTDRLAPPQAFVPTWKVMGAIEPPLVHRQPEPYSGPVLMFEVPGYLGSIGFIPNVTEHFCSQCNRLALTDHGEIASCIFGRGLSLLRHMRSPGALDSTEAFIDRVVRRKLSLAAKMGGPEAAAISPVIAQIAAGIG